MDNRILVAVGIGLVVVFLLAFVVPLGSSGSKQELGKEKIVLYKTQNCGCCGGYASYLSQYYDVEVKVVSQSELEEIKNTHHIPRNMWSCHTMKAGNYFIEGHVPVEAIDKMLKEKPEINGIALPGMPSGSPGMAGMKVQPFKIYALSGSEAVLYMTV